MTSDMAYPLHWPLDRPRTPAHQRKPARFDVSLSRAVNQLHDELRRIDATYIVISSNLPGYEKAGVWRPYADAAQPRDPGVAVYFVLGTQPTCMTCDKWPKVRDNIRAIQLTLEAMRAQERWGASDRQAQFAGYRALPPSASDWRSVLNFSPGATPTRQQLRERYRELAFAAHPDRAANPVAAEEAMKKLGQALGSATAELGYDD